MSAQSEVGDTPSHNQPSTSKDNSRSEMVKSIVAGIMESQAETITRMTNETIEAFIDRSKNAIQDEVEDRIKS